MSEKRQRYAMISVRLTGPELEYVERQAKEAGMTISAYIRSKAVPTERERIAAAWGVPVHLLGPER